MYGSGTAAMSYPRYDRVSACLHSRCVTILRRPEARTPSPMRVFRARTTISAHLRRVGGTRVFGDHAAGSPCRHKHTAYRPAVIDKSPEVVSGRQCRLPGSFAVTLHGNPAIGRKLIDGRFRKANR